MDRETLNALREARGRVDITARQIQELRASVADVGGLRFHGVRESGERMARQEVFLEKLEKLERRYTARLETYMKLYKEVVYAVKGFPDIEKKIVLYRYGEALAWDEVNRRLSINRHKSQYIMRCVLRKLSQQSEEGGGGK